MPISPTNAALHPQRLKRISRFAPVSGVSQKRSGVHDARSRARCPRCQSLSPLSVRPPPRGAVEPLFVTHRLSALRTFFRWLEDTDVISVRTVDKVARPRIPHAHSKAAHGPIRPKPSSKRIAARPKTGSKPATLLCSASLRGPSHLGGALSPAETHRSTAAMLSHCSKGGKERLVPILPVTQEAISAYLALCPYPLDPDAPLFVGAKGGPLSPRIIQLLIVPHARRARPARNGHPPRAPPLIRDTSAIVGSGSPPDSRASGPRLALDDAGLYGFDRDHLLAIMISLIRALNAVPPRAL